MFFLTQIPQKTSEVFLFFIMNVYILKRFVCQHLPVAHEIRVKSWYNYMLIPLQEKCDSLQLGGKEHVYIGNSSLSKLVRNIGMCNNSKNPILCIIMSALNTVPRREYLQENMNLKD